MGTGKSFGYTGVRDESSFVDLSRVSTLVFPDSTLIPTGADECKIDIGLGWLTPKMYGAIADGSTHPLSGFYGSLAAAQVVYPFVTALTQELDWAALQKMSYEALGYPTFEHADTSAYLNKPMFIPGGNYMLGADTWLIRNASGIKITGAGRRSTKIFGSGIVFQTDGLWYSQIEGIWFETTGAAAAVVDIDGNVPGQPYATRGVQSNTYKDIGVHGGSLATYGFAMTRLGNPPGPGAQGSENLFLACVFNNCVQANWYSTGFNALQNTFIGGNIQGHQKHGIYIIAGSIQVYSVGFQSTYAYTQIVNDGYDINANASGVNDRITAIGCRTESARFYRGGASQPPVLVGNTQSYGGDVGWTPNLASYYDLNDTIIKYSPTLGRQMYRVTTAGTSGGDSVTDADVFSSSTIGKTTKAWTVNQWAGWRVRIIGGTGGGDSAIYLVTSNTATTLTIVGTFATTPDATTDFYIEPNWPDSGTVTDNTVVWTMTPVKVVDCAEAYFRANSFDFGQAVRTSMTESPVREITSDYTATVDDEFLLCTNTVDITIKLPSSASPQAPIGKRYYIKKQNTNSATITVQDSDAGAIEGVAGSGLIPGGSRGWLVVERAGTSVTSRYWIIAQDPEIVATTTNTASKIVKRDANGVVRFSGSELESFNGAEWIRGATTEQITLNTGGTTTDSTADLLPANSVIESVVAVVDITITTAANWQIGDAATANRFIGSTAGLGAGIKAVGLRHHLGSVTTDAAGPTQTAAAKIRITTDVNPGAGKIRVVVFYSQFVAPNA